MIKVAVAMFGAFVVTGLLVVLVARTAPNVAVTPRPMIPRLAVVGQDVAPVAVRIESIENALVANRTLPTAAFRVEPDESLDPRIPPGPFTATLTVQAAPGGTTSAYVGAQVENAQLIIRRGDRILLSDFGGPEGRLIMTDQPIGLSARRPELTFEVSGDGRTPTAFRAVWRPESPVLAEATLVLPVASGGSFLDAAQRGRLLAQQHQCVSCHAADGASALLANATAAPDLANIGARARPEWIQRWLTDPHDVMPSSRMPHVTALTGRDDIVQDLTHFLTSLGGPFVDDTAAPTTEFINTGRVMYHQVGCFACHGPLESLESLPGGRRGAGTPRESYASLEGLRGKTNVTQLTEFLLNPLATRPHGTMPSMALTRLEAESLASYLVSVFDPAPVASFASDSQRVNAGARQFVALGCTNCHEVGSVSLPVMTTAPRLTDLVLDRGCLADAPGAPAMDFRFRDAERRDLRAFLEQVPQYVCADVPVDDIAVGLARLDCMSCHEFHNAPGPERAVAAYFETLEEEADLGDEGRIPPHLSHAGARLTSAWMHDVLGGESRARPYIAARMPAYGDQNTVDIPHGLKAIAGFSDMQVAEPKFTFDAAAHGRELVGAQRFNCIQCHTIAGNPSTGTPGPDLALMPGRLTYDSFQRWMHDPRLTAPGTRMPSFFLNGFSAHRDVLGGKAADQIAAVWSYLSQGEALPLPDGFLDEGGFELVAGEDPIVFRTFMNSAGVRAIACGFPEQVHCAFDADRCVLAVAWTGRFLNASGAWGARGGSETNADEYSWTAPKSSALSIDGRDTDVRFRGYELDDGGRPIFLYQLVSGDVTVNVREQPMPMMTAGRARLERQFTLEGPDGVSVRWNPEHGAVDREVREIGAGGVTFSVEVNW